MNSNTIKIYSEKTCPHLGIINDERTAMAFPTLQNFCHQCVPPNIPNISHQREFCLAEKHSQCPLFLSEVIQPMPPELLSGKANKSGRSKKKTIGLILLLLLILLLGLWLLTRPGGISSFFASVERETPKIASIPKGETKTATIPTVTLQPSPTATEIIPTLTSTPVQPHMLETPIGVENKLLVHQVKAGESLISIALAYDTTVDAIKAINYNNGTFWVDSLLVIPVGQKDVSTTQQYKVILIDKEDDTLQDLATRYSADIQMLSQINFLPETYSFHYGEWVLIPVIQKTP
jgi:LysM repeat protein